MPTRSRSHSLSVPFLSPSGLSILGAALLAGLAGCTKAPATAGAAKPVEVSVAPVTASAVPVSHELPGRVVSPRVALVRARVTGVLQKQHFVEGAEVQIGERLFTIEPEPLEAALESAQATLAKAEASLAQLQATADRSAELLKIDAVSREAYDTAVAALAAQRAEILAARAAARTAELNLAYTQVTAPIAGRIGRASVTEGALVSSGELTELAVIRQLDPVYVDFTQSSADVLKLRRAVATGSASRVADADLPVTLVLEDGSLFEHAGKLHFADIAVDETTGMVTLRAEFPNSERLLLPGAFVRVRLAQAVENRALTVPQRSVVRNADGSATAYVVGSGNKIEARRIATADAFGDRWVVSQGLQVGETLVVEGIQKVRDGMPVTTVPFAAPSAASPTSVAGATVSEALSSED